MLEYQKRDLHWPAWHPWWFLRPSPRCKWPTPRSAWHGRPSAAREPCTRIRCAVGERRGSGPPPRTLSEKRPKLWLVTSSASSWRLARLAPFLPPLSPSLAPPALPVLLMASVSSCVPDACEPQSPKDPRKGEEDSELKMAPTALTGAACDAALSSHCLIEMLGARQTTRRDAFPRSNSCLKNLNIILYRVIA